MHEGTTHGGARHHAPPHPSEMAEQLRARAEQMGADALRGAIAPDRSMEQRMAALDKGNRIRTVRKNLKRKLKVEGIPATVDLLLDPPMDIETMKVIDLMLATKSFGKVKTGQYLQRLIISPSKTVGGLTARQRSELVRALRYGL